MHYFLNDPLQQASEDFWETRLDCKPLTSLVSSQLSCLKGWLNYEHLGECYVLMSVIKTVKLNCFFSTRHALGMKQDIGIVVTFNDM